jgi:hypothetical protein
MVNVCGWGTSNYINLYVPIQTTSDNLNYYYKVRAYGQHLQSGSWVSCVAVSGNSGTVQFSARDTTSGTGGAVFETLDLGNMYTYYGAYFDCEVTYGGGVDYGFWY